tara:strand:- start:3649 stop:4260 length:612 start_codon:yes stop_codon:yes gene_type:complete
MTINNISAINPCNKSKFYLCLFNTNQSQFLTFYLHRDKQCGFLHVNFNESKSQTLKDIHILIKPFNAQFRKFLQDGEDFYLFYESKETSIPTYNKKSDFFWTTIYEIVQLQSIFNIPIRKNTYNIFYKKPELLSLVKKPFPILIYTTQNVLDLFTYSNGYSIKNCKIVKIKKILRCICFEKFSNIENDTFYFNKLDDIQIISE